MEIKKENGKYYVNGLDLQEVLSNRKHIISYVNNQIIIVRRMLADNKYNQSTIITLKTRLKTLEDVKKELDLRK
jgi:hypothetical protein|nr:MAG TPA: hypothetical protein [Caudoviricetes sp.]